MLIISFGIMALVGILTSIDSIKYYLNENFMMMGANTFTIRNRSMRIQMGNRTTLPRNFRSITWQEAMNFKSQFDFPAYTSVYTNASGTATIKYGSEKTNPNISIIGSDENYLITSGNEIERGRNLSGNEVLYGTHAVVLGFGVVDKLFKNNEDPVDKIISIGSAKYRVVGVMKSKGSSMGFNPDNICIIPVTNARQAFSRANMTYSVNIMVNDPMMLEPAIGEAT